MNKETLDYITKQYKTEEEIKTLFSLFRSKYNVQTIEISHIKSFGSLQKEEKKRFIIKNCVYKPNILLEKYDFLKRSIDKEITEISTLNDEKKVIYGIYYKDKYGMDTLEDSHGTILVNFKDCLTNGFLYENIFVGLEGRLENMCTSDKTNLLDSGNENLRVNKEKIDDGRSNKYAYSKFNDCKLNDSKLNDSKCEDIRGNLFVCEKIVYPKIKVFQNKNGFLAECLLKVLVFSCYTTKSKQFVDETISEIKPDIVVLSIHDTSKSYKNDSVETIVYRCGCISKRMPNKMEGDNASNPFIIETYNKKISFISHDIVQYRKNGIFLNKNPLDSFLRTFVSQYSYNPFYKANLSYEEIPNIIVIAQKFYPFIMDIEGVKVASIMPVENKSYLLLDLSNDNIKMVCENI